MKKRTVFMLLMLIAAALSVLVGYMVLDRMYTDSTPPKITIADQVLSVSVSDPREVLLQGVTAQDDLDGDVTPSLVIESLYGIDEEHRATVVYAAFDSSGNVSKAQRQVLFADYHSPRLTLSGPLIFTYGHSFDVYSVLDATDQFDGDVSNKIKATMVSAGSAITEQGLHQVLFRITNSMGDSTQLELPVEVNPSGRYDAEVELTDYLIYLPKGAPFSRQQYLKSLTTYNSEVDLTGVIPDGITIRYDGNVDTHTPGVYAVTYTVTYTLNQRSFTGYTKLLVVIEQ